MGFKAPIFNSFIIKNKNKTPDRVSCFICVKAHKPTLLKENCTKLGKRISIDHNHYKYHRYISIKDLKLQ